MKLTEKVNSKEILWKFVIPDGAPGTGCRGSGIIRGSGITRGSGPRLNTLNVGGGPYYTVH